MSSLIYLSLLFDLNIIKIWPEKNCYPVIKTLFNTSLEEVQKIDEDICQIAQFRSRLMYSQLSFREQYALLDGDQWLTFAISKNVNLPCI